MPHSRRFVSVDSVSFRVGLRGAYAINGFHFHFTAASADAKVLVSVNHVDLASIFALCAVKDWGVNLGFLVWRVRGVGWGGGRTHECTV